MKTVKVEILPRSFLSYIAHLDAEGVGYSMACRGFGVWELEVDSVDNGMHVTLKSDGSWVVTSNIPVCEGE